MARERKQRPSRFSICQIRSPVSILHERKTASSPALYCHVRNRASNSHHNFHQHQPRQVTRADHFTPSFRNAARTRTHRRNSCRRDESCFTLTLIRLTPPYYVVLEGKKCRWQSTATRQFRRHDRILSQLETTTAEGNPMENWSAISYHHDVLLAHLLTRGQSALEWRREVVSAA